MVITWGNYENLNENCIGTAIEGLGTCPKLSPRSILQFVRLRVEKGKSCGGFLARYNSHVCIRVCHLFQLHISLYNAQKGVVCQSLPPPPVCAGW